MPEVQNVGAVDYAQYQPSQYQNDAYVEDYNTQPEVYDENMAEVQAANKSRLGATILTAAIIGGLGLIGGHMWGAHGKKAAETAKETAEKALEEIKNSDAVKNYDKLKDAAEKVEKEVTDHNPFSWWGIKKYVKDAFAFLKQDSKKVAEEAEEGAKKAADDAAEAAEGAA
jgi:hypothetical protein